MDIDADIDTDVCAHNVYIYTCVYACVCVDACRAVVGEGNYKSITI